ncbi:site-specific integrase [Ferrimonas balearica]|uniref:site-specific integrase n=1 Tax=Ferrimonas balearica TaxID=44012 RepID=UPI001C99CA46|nr:site-specific integrase [Ferrimonas balearica]MBY5992490.1 tyrosine-type recombinase/integrase [Ferrimonas balearica]
MRNKKQEGMPPGVMIRTYASGKEAIYVRFSLNGRAFREKVEGLDPDSRRDIRAAGQLVQSIKHQIFTNTFDYARTFPKGSKIDEFTRSRTPHNIRTWLVEYQKMNERRGLSPNTVASYERWLTKFGLIDRIPLERLKASDIAEWIMSSNQAASVIRGQFRFLRAALDEAVLADVINANPARSVRPNRYIRTDYEEKECDPFTRSERDDIVEAAFSLDERAGLVIEFWFEVGVRTSELIGLKWDCVDLNRKQIHIRRARTCNGVERETVKTKKSRRTIDLTPRACELLKRQKAYSFLLGEYVFLNRQGAPYHDPGRFSKVWWKKVIEASGVRYRRAYTIRHTYASHHITEGCNLFWLMDQMGHTSLEMLSQVYGKFMSERTERGSLEVRGGEKV